MNHIFKQLKNFFRRKIKGKTDDELLADLIEKGLKIGRNFSKQEGCIIDGSHCWLISIGNNVTLAPRVQILAHDASTKMFLGYAKIGLVEIGSNVFVGAGSIILPNVRIGSNVIIGAGSVVTKDIPCNSLAVGNPARVTVSTDAYISRHRDFMQNRPVYDENWTARHSISGSQKEQMIAELRSGIGYVE